MCFAHDGRCEHNVRLALRVSWQSLLSRPSATHNQFAIRKEYTTNTHQKCIVCTLKGFSRKLPSERRRFNCQGHLVPTHTLTEDILRPVIIISVSFCHFSLSFAKCDKEVLRVSPICQPDRPTCRQPSSSEFETRKTSGCGLAGC